MPPPAERGSSTPARPRSFRDFTTSTSTSSDWRGPGVRSRSTTQPTVPRSPARIAAAARAGNGEAWLTGRGWSERQLAGVDAAALDAAAGERLAFLTSHDGHSAWASPVARRLAGLGAETSDPPGGRLERGAGGEPTGILRETAMDLVAPLVTRLQGAALRDALDATLRELAALGVTGASEAGDYTDRNGIGADAALGDSYSTLTDLGDLVDGRLRLTLGIPADAVPAAAERGLRTGAALEGRRTMRFGWAKEYADGALGSGTAALFEPRSCGTPDAGILRVSPEELDALFAAGRSAGIGLAVHAIGDRAAAAVLDAVERAPERRSNAPSDRLEHAQLLRRDEVDRFARLGSHGQHPADPRGCRPRPRRGMLGWPPGPRLRLALAACPPARTWRPDRTRRSNRSIPGSASSRPSIGACRPIREATGDPQQALTIAEALSAYTLGPARALGAHDEGHLRPGARADLAVLSVDLDTLLAADERLPEVRAELAIVDGVEVPIA